MKGIPDMRFWLTFVLVGSSLAALAQLKQLPIVRTSANQSGDQSARIQSLPSKKLPFWDDFSFPKTAGYPNDTLWQNGNSVWVNNSMGINPPTINVATFDGLNSEGVPYNLTNASAKGIADSLTSRSLRLDVADSLKNRIFISFFYQFQGNGEAPDPGDELSLWFKDSNSTWKQVWSASTSADPTQFVPVKIFVNDTCKACFHSDFQFRFQNYARLSGPFDTWNLDYVYVSNGRSQYAPVRMDFPDRAIATPITSMLNQYNSIPVKHLLSNGDALLTPPSLVYSNMRADQIDPFKQPIAFAQTLDFASRQNNMVTTSTTPIDSITGLFVSYGVNQSVAFTLMPSFVGLSSGIDSIAVRFNLTMNSGDNVTKVASPPKGDFDTAVYKGINFKYNDAASRTFSFTNYYAYDDGEAEYAIGLTQANSYLAYQFDMKYSQPDTLVAVDIYFPHVSDETNQVVQLMGLTDLVTNINYNKNGIIFLQDIVVKRTANSLFTRYVLDTARIVRDTFYLGYKQKSDARIGVGFDRNSDSGNKLFKNLFGLWAPADDLHGNVMIRPVFGNRPVSVVTGLPEVKKGFAYPNPTHGVFYLPEAIQNLSVVDIMGNAALFIQEDSYEKTQVTITTPAPGIYLARYFDGTQWRTEKIMVLP